MSSRPEAATSTTRCGRRACLPRIPTRSVTCTSTTSGRAHGWRSVRATRRRGRASASEGCRSGRRPAHPGSVALAVDARDRALFEGVPGPLLVAASMGPYGATLHDGSEYRGRYGVTAERLATFHRERLDVLVGAGPDLLAVETIPDVDEAAVLVGCWPTTQTCRRGSRTRARTGVRPRRGSRSKRPCGSLPRRPRWSLWESTARRRGTSRSWCARAASTAPRLPVVVYPNAGGSWDPRRGWRDLEVTSPTLPDDQVRGWAAGGARLVGGCCGLGPDAVRGISAALAA